METLTTLKIFVDGTGVALITLNDPGKPMNVVTPEFITDFMAVIECVATDSAIKGAIVTSGKNSFMAGADLKYIVGMAGGAVTHQQAVAFSERASQMHRRIESCGKPFVAAINGLALGGGFELCLACHSRIMVDDPKTIVGLPEVTVGLLPGSGGTQRLPRMIGVEPALSVLLDGKNFAPAEALKLGLVDAVVPAAALIETARQSILKGIDPVRAWDKKGYRCNTGLLDSRLAMLYTMRPALIAAQTQRNYPAPIAILSCVFDGTMMPFDKALGLESKYFAQLLCDPVSRNIIRTTFVSKGELGGLSRRPADVPKAKFGKVGILGSGMMGSGISYVAAAAGIDVVLLDTDLARAEKGKAYSAKVLDKEVQRGKKSREQADAVLGRISTTTSYADLAGCELIVEAVFEDRAIKADVTRSTEAVIPTNAVFASNTSTLPISELAEASARPKQFIGLHFFSPVDRMPLVEVIVGKKTSQETVARALDFVGQLRMVPIVVTDSRGFYTSRVFQTFIHEGMRMVEEGVLPALVENAAKMAGMPVGPLAVTDEVTLELPMMIIKQSDAALGSKFVRPSGYNVLKRMLDEFKRPGKRDGKGFYDYPEGGKKRLWPGLKHAFPPSATQPAVEEVRKRLLYIQSLETVRCLEEGVLASAKEGDVGSLLGWGFPSWTGGTLSLIETVGLKPFVAECDRMAKNHGPRFKPSKGLRARAASNENFYGP
jgi:3-hydroxyacyl-CoA dehydrogenase / enoyl-CoA hydratase / 3-hydroxybutyryl-CoA epimerase